MSRTFHQCGKQHRQIRVRGVRKEHPDLRRLARALIEFAQLQAEADAQAEDAARKNEAANAATSEIASTDGDAA